MEERTFINNIDIHNLAEKVCKCKCYDDARKYLNAFIIENIGKQYETEDGAKYRNSRNPKDIKRETIIELNNYIRAFRHFDDVSERGLVIGRKYMEKSNIMFDDIDIVDAFGNIKNSRELLFDFIEVWEKEPVPINQQKNTKRLRPKEGNEHYIDAMFERLKELGYLDKDENESTWRYLCGTTDNIPDKPMKWKGSFVEFAALYDFFLVVRQKIFTLTGKGSEREFVVSLFGYDYENGFKQQLSRDYTRLPEERKKEIWNKMRDPQMTFT